MTPESPRPWERVGSEPGASYRIFDLHVHRARSPRTGKVHSFVILETPDWVNVVAVTLRHEIVLIRQVRHGIGSVTLEIPGGMVDPGETPREAAARELLEETGYRAGRWRTLGFVHPNPAFQDNRCHSFLALDCERVAEPAHDSAEDIVLEVRGLAELPELVASGSITHGLVLNALWWFEIWQRNHAIREGRGADVSFWGILGQWVKMMEIGCLEGEGEGK